MDNTSFACHMIHAAVHLLAREDLDNSVDIQSHHILLTALYNPDEETCLGRLLDPRQTQKLVDRVDEVRKLLSELERIDGKYDAEAGIPLSTLEGTEHQLVNMRQSTSTLATTSRSPGKPTKSTRIGMPKKKQSEGTKDRINPLETTRRKIDIRNAILGLQSSQYA